jgi:DNA-binding CsgD family transcriptional regulator
MPKSGAAVEEAEPSACLERRSRSVANEPCRSDPWVHNVAVLAGREAELASVAELLSDLQPVLVTGEAGVGKTALLLSAAERLALPAFHGGALSTLAWMDYLPFARALGRDPVGTDPEAVASDVQRAVGEDGLLVLDDLQWSSPLALTAVSVLAGVVRIAVGVRTGTRDEDEVADALEEAGFHRIALSPLDGPSSSRVARQFRPSLSEAEVTAVVERAGGNPLLLRELAVSGESSLSLQRTVAARLRRLPEPEREAFAMLALAGRPLSLRSFTPPVISGLEASRLVDRTGPARDHFGVRHALLADAAVAALGPDEVRALHGRLAELVTSPGEKARHYDLAGNPEGSREAALVAAEEAALPGERASHLRVAATNSHGQEADTLRLAAAESLAAAHEWEGVFTVLDQVVGTDAATVGQASLLRAQAAWSGGRAEELQPALEAGLAACVELDPASTVETLLRVEACRVPIFVEGDFEAGVTQAEEAYRLAEETGVGQARALYFLGTALACIDRQEAPGILEQAIQYAQDSGDVSTELTSANNLIAYHESSGSPGLGADRARAMADRSTQLGLGSWESSFTQQALQLDYHAGHYDGLTEAMAELASRPLDRRTRDSLLEAQCMALTDVGRADESIRLAQEYMALATPDTQGRTHFWWTLAEAAWWSGDPKRALTYADQFLTELPEWNINRSLGELTRAWACYELGEDPGPPASDWDRPMVFALPYETAALGHAHAQRWEEAVAGFRAASPLWAPYHVRGELRCEWAAGEALRKAGELDEAVRCLLMAEKRCEDIGLVAVLNRIRRSLRLAGERRTVARTTTGAGLTGREQEVLELVARGLTNEQIAARLGITRRTVVAQVSSASTKLGAENRIHAATLAATLAAELPQDPG